MGVRWYLTVVLLCISLMIPDVELYLFLNAVLNTHSDPSLCLSRKEMKLLEQAGALKGSLSAEEQLSLISGCPNIQEAVEGAMHIQVSEGHWGLRRLPASPEETGQWQVWAFCIFKGRILFYVIGNVVLKTPSILGSHQTSVTMFCFRRPMPYPRGHWGFW